ncbi:MAG: hypothetical protein ACI97A_004144 [Planctomycetota bacterium]
MLLKLVSGQRQGIFIPHTVILSCNFDSRYRSFQKSWPSQVIDNNPLAFILNVINAVWSHIERLSRFFATKPSELCPTIEGTREKKTPVSFRVTVEDDDNIKERMNDVAIKVSKS